MAPNSPESAARSIWSSMLSLALVSVLVMSALAAAADSAAAPTDPRSAAHLLSTLPALQTTKSNSLSSRGQVHRESAASQTTSVKWSDLTSVLAGAPPPSSGTQIAYDAADGYLMLYGGYNAAGSLSTTWQFANTTWTQVPTSGSPPGTNLGAMAYDGADGYVVLFGGNLNGVSSTGQTWTYQAGTWTELNPSPAPGGRAAPAMIYDAADGYVLLFGGCSPAYSSVCEQSRNDTWEFKAGTWTQLTPPTSPPARTDAAIAYDPTLGDVVMFGGCVQISGTCSAALNDTWEFRGGVWTLIHTAASPSARFGASMAYDPSVGHTVLFGGSTLSGSPLNDTWEFTGSHWVELYTGPSPPGRWRFSLAYDSAYSELVLFGGNDPSGWLGDTWALTVASEQPAISAVSISPGSSGLASGATGSFSARATSTGGASLSTGVNFSWSFSPSSLGILNATRGSSITFTAGFAKENGTLFVNATYQGVTKEGAASISATGASSSASSPFSPLDLVLIAVVVIVAAAAGVVVLLSRRKKGGSEQRTSNVQPPAAPPSPPS